MSGIFEENGLYLENADCIPKLKSMADESVDCVVTDIPFGGVNRSSNGLRNLNKHEADIVTFDLDALCKELCRVSKGSIYVFCGWAQLSTIYQVLSQAGYSTRIIVWEKTNPSPMNGEYIWLSGIELCVYGKKRGAIYNGFCKNSVLRYPSGINKIHDTEKPTALISELIETSSNAGDLILDPFAGSASTAVACYELGRRFIGYEIDETYYKRAVQRLQDLTAQIRMEI